MLLGSLAVVAFGLTLPATRLAVPYLDPMFIGLGRAVVAALVAILWLGVTRSRPPTKDQLPRLAVVAAGVVIGFPLLSACATESANASHGAVVLGTLPLGTAVVGAVVSDERPSIGFWLSALGGAALVVGYALWSGTGTIRVGDIALFGAVASAAVGYAVGGQLARAMGGGKVICWALVLSLPAIVLPAWVTAPQALAAIPPGVWAGFLYLALVLR